MTPTQTAGAVERGVGMKTNGIGKPVDWLNHAVSMASDPEVRRAKADANIVRRLRDTATRERRIAHEADEPLYPRWAGDERI